MTIKGLLEWLNESISPGQRDSFKSTLRRKTKDDVEAEFEREDGTGDLNELEKALNHKALREGLGTLREILEAMKQKELKRVEAVRQKELARLAESTMTDMGTEPKHIPINHDDDLGKI